MKSYEVESKASRETLRRLVADVDHEQKASAIRASDLNSVRQVQYIPAHLSDSSQECNNSDSDTCLF